MGSWWEAAAGCAGLVGVSRTEFRNLAAVLDPFWTLHISIYTSISTRSSMFTPPFKDGVPPVGREVDEFIRLVGPRDHPFVRRTLFAQVPSPGRAQGPERSGADRPSRRRPQAPGPRFPRRWSHRPTDHSVHSGPTVGTVPSMLHRPQKDHRLRPVTSHPGRKNRSGQR